MVIVSNPRTFKVPDWFLNRQRDHKDGRTSQLTASALDTKLREDLERLKKIRYGHPKVTFQQHIGQEMPAGLFAVSCPVPPIGVWRRCM